MNRAKTNLTPEQEICIKCGMCCDGTLFNHGVLEKGEKEFLPTLLQIKSIVTENDERFEQPCPCFDKKCTIYDQKKPLVCSTFRCQLLKNLSKEKINKVDAEQVVKNAIELRSEIFVFYEAMNYSNEPISFRELLFEINKKKQLMN